MYAVEIFRRVSWQTSFMIVRESTPRLWASRPTSFAKVTLTAWNMLQQYLRAPAVRIEVTTNSHDRWPKDLSQHLCRLFRIGPHHRKWRVVLILDRGAFAQEFQLDIQVELRASAFARMPLDDRFDDTLDRTRQG